MGESQKKRVVNAREAINLLDTAVTMKGRDYVYPTPGTCVNWNDDGTPSCIVGHVLHYLGATPELTGEGTAMQTCETFFYRQGTVVFTPAAITVLRVAQSVQDNGGTWGLAYDTAQSISGTLSEMNGVDRVDQ